MLSEAINYPRQSDHMLKTVVIGGVLSLLSVLVIPALVLGGYLIRVLRYTNAGNDDLPEFGDWGQLAIDGLKAAVITIGYAVVPVALFALSVGVLSGTVEIIGYVASGVTYVAMIYCLPAALTIFAREERMGAAFSMSNLRSVLTSRQYVGGWLRAVVVGVASGIIGGALGLVPIVGFVVSVFVAFYVNLVTAYLFGHAVADADRLAVPGEEQPTAPPVA